MLPAVLGRTAILGYVDTGRVGQVDNIGVGQDVELVALSVQLHGVRHFVPAEAGEAAVESCDVAGDDHVRLEIGPPFDLKRETPINK